MSVAQFASQAADECSSGIFVGFFVGPELYLYDIERDNLVFSRDQQLQQYRLFFGEFDILPVSDQLHAFAVEAEFIIDKGGEVDNGDISFLFDPTYRFDAV